MAKFLTVVALNIDPEVRTTFEAESAGEVLQVLKTLLTTPSAQVMPQGNVEDATVLSVKPTPKRRGRPPKSGVVGVITPAGAAAVQEPAVAEEPAPSAPLPTLAEISDAIRAYARQPGVGVPGVTAFIREFKTAAGEPAQQVKAIAQSEYPAIVARLKTLLVVS